MISLECQLGLADQMQALARSPARAIARRLLDLCRRIHASKTESDPFGGLKVELEAILAESDAAGHSRNELTVALMYEDWSQKGMSVEDRS
jgi:hypothetical protein